MGNWYDRYSGKTWLAKLRQRVRATRGDVPDLIGLVDDVQQDVLEDTHKRVESGRYTADKISDPLMLQLFDWRFIDHCRKIYGTVHPPQWLVEVVGSRKLAVDIYTLVCLDGTPAEWVAGRIMRWVEIGERNYNISEDVPFGEDLIHGAARMIKERGACKPPRVAVSTDQPSGPDDDGGDGAAIQLPAADVAPEQTAADDEISELMKILTAGTRDRVAPKFAALHKKFNDDKVLSNLDKLILRVQTLNPDKATDIAVAKSLKMKPHTFRRTRDRALERIRQWLYDNDLGDIAPDD